MLLYLKLEQLHDAFFNFKLLQEVLSGSCTDLPLFRSLETLDVRKQLQKLLQLSWTINKLAVRLLLSIIIPLGILGLYHYSQIKNLGQ